VFLAKNKLKELHSVALKKVHFNASIILSCPKGQC